MQVLFILRFRGSQGVQAARGSEGTGGRQGPQSPGCLDMETNAWAFTASTRLEQARVRPSCSCHAPPCGQIWDHLQPTVPNALQASLPRLPPYLPDCYLPSLLPKCGGVSGSASSPLAFSHISPWASTSTPTHTHIYVCVFQSLIWSKFRIALECKNWKITLNSLSFSQISCMPLGKLLKLSVHMINHL